MRSKEEKQAIVKQVIAGESLTKWEGQGIRHEQVRRWVKKYEQEGEAGLESKKKPGNLGLIDQYRIEKTIEMF